MHRVFGLHINRKAIPRCLRFHNQVLKATFSNFIPSLALTLLLFYLYSVPALQFNRTICNTTPENRISVCYRQHILFNIRSSVLTAERTYATAAAAARELIHYACDTTHKYFSHQGEGASNVRQHDERQKSIFVEYSSVELCVCVCAWHLNAFMHALCHLRFFGAILWVFDTFDTLTVAVHVIWILAYLMAGARKIIGDRSWSRSGSDILRTFAFDCLFSSYYWKTFLLFSFCRSCLRCLRIWLFRGKRHPNDS